MPGRITLSFEREPSYFLGCRTLGPFWQVAAARHAATGAIGAVACRAVRPRFVNGHEADVGYLSQLRVDGPFRGRWLAVRLLRGLDGLHADGRTSGYLATITDDNAEALGLLVRRPRPGLPTFRQVARIWTLALHVRLRHAPGFSTSTCGSALGYAQATELGEIVAFLRREGSRKQFFPAYSAADFGLNGTTPDFRIEDFVVARTPHGGAIAGVMGLWDQTSYKQTVVRGYRGTLRWLRPAFNAAARLASHTSPPLPAPGAHLRAAYAAFVCVSGDDPGIFSTLLRRVCARAAARGFAFVLVGLAAGDPLLDVARRFPHVAYGSTLYTVCLPGDEVFHSLPDDRVPYVEIASL
jgi:hypothetical protein